jgi:hypothetical protein
MVGAFHDQARTRMEFLELIKLRSGASATRDSASTSLACMVED